MPPRPAQEPPLRLGDVEDRGFAAFKRQQRRFGGVAEFFIDYCITKGQVYGPALDFAPLPKVVLAAAKKAVGSL